MTREEAKEFVAAHPTLKNLSDKDKQLLIQALKVLANHWSMPESE